MNETSKAYTWRKQNHYDDYLVGDGIDIGCGKDIVKGYQIKSVQAYDKPQGDAQFMTGIKENTFDFVHSSHCLEHLNDWEEGLIRWIEICKVGGHVVIAIPDQHIYEHDQWPSKYNQDHKWSFVISDDYVLLPKTVQIKEYLNEFKERLGVQICLIELNDQNYDYRKTKIDQTLGNASAQIEIVLRKVK